MDFGAEPGLQTPEHFFQDLVDMPLVIGDCRYGTRRAYWMLGGGVMRRVLGG